MNYARYMDGSLVKTTQKYTRNRWKKMFSLCPFELPAKQHRPVSPSWPNGRCCLAGNSKGHRRISKIFLSLFLYTWVDQNIFFPEIYNAPIISELGFTVCLLGLVACKIVEKGSCCEKARITLHCGTNFLFKLLQRIFYHFFAE